MRIEHHDTHVEMSHGRGSAICVSLEQRYAGLRFEEVSVSVLRPSALTRYRDADAVEVHFTVSGSLARLLRHGFALQDWFETANDEAARRSIAGCRAWEVSRTESGYKVEMGRYPDGLDRICAVLFTPWWQQMTRKFITH